MAPGASRYKTRGLLSKFSSCVPKYILGTRSNRKTRVKPTPNCHRRSRRTHVADVDDVWEEGAQMAWLVDRERARWEGANWALEAGVDPHICLAGPAVPVSRRSQNRGRARSNSPVRLWVRRAPQPAISRYLAVVCHPRVGRYSQVQAQAAHCVAWLRPRVQLASLRSSLGDSVAPPPPQSLLFQDP